MAISKVFDIAKRSLMVYRKALDVTSHNIANTNNPNFSRQKVIFTSDTSNLTSGLVWGNGVKISDVRRFRDNFIETQSRIVNSRYYDNKKQSDIISGVEKILSEPSEIGLGNLIGKFFNSFSELAASPTSNPLRSNVLNAATNLAAKVNMLNNSFNNIKESLKSEFDEKIKTINKLLLQINQLNRDIKSNQIKNITINDLLDNRDNLLLELSKLVNINVNLASDNSISVSIGGTFAVDLYHHSEFEMIEENGQLGLRIKGSANTAILTDGELNAISNIYSTKLVSYKQKLDTVVNKIVEEVNKIHSVSYTKTTPPQTGLKFFEDYNGNTLNINSLILKNPNLLAISSDGSLGNGDNANKISELLDKKLIDNSTIMEYYLSFVNDVGNDVLINKNLAEANLLVIDQLQQQKQTYSGVSLDEEMTNILQFQRSYEASARLIKVADELLKTILELV